MREVKRIFYEKYSACDVNQIRHYTRGKYTLGKLKNPVVYSVDCIFRKHPERGGKRCDEFVFYNLSHIETGIDLIEIKDSESIDAEKIKEQLQGGAGFIEYFLDNDPATDGQPFDFRAFCVSKGIRPSERKKLVNCKINIRDKAKRIRHVKFNRTLK